MQPHGPFFKSWTNAQGFALGGCIKIQFLGSETSKNKDTFSSRCEETSIRTRDSKHGARSREPGLTAPHTVPMTTDVERLHLCSASQAKEGHRLVSPTLCTPGPGHPPLGSAHNHPLLQPPPRSPLCTPRPRPFLSDLCTCSQPPLARGRASARGFRRLAGICPAPRPAACVAM